MPEVRSERITRRKFEFSYNSTDNDRKTLVPLLRLEVRLMNEF